MSKPDSANGNNVRVIYGAVPGCTLKATLLARLIEHCFQVPVVLESQDSDTFEVLANDRSIYQHQGPCDFKKGQGAIIADLAQIIPQIQPMPHTPDDDLDADDPDHRDWMRHVCSGE